MHRVPFGHVAWWVKWLCIYGWIHILCKWPSPICTAFRYVIRFRAISIGGKARGPFFNPPLFIEWLLTVPRLTESSGRA